MTKLFRYGEALGIQGTGWQSEPPRFYKEADAGPETGPR
jgi:hypothetical protein